MLRGEKEVLGEKPVPISLYRPKISHVFTQTRSRATVARYRRPINVPWLVRLRRRDGDECGALVD